VGSGSLSYGGFFVSITILRRGYEEKNEKKVKKNTHKPPPPTPFPQEEGYGGDGVLFPKSHLARVRKVLRGTCYFILGEKLGEKNSRGGKTCPGRQIGQ